MTRFIKGYRGVNKQGLRYEVVDDRLAKKTKVRFDLDGAEVVQVYIGKLNSKVSRAEKELKGFPGSELKWNFTKFLVDRDGEVVKRYASATAPESLADDIEALL